MVERFIGKEEDIIVEEAGSGVVTWGGKSTPPSAAELNVTNERIAAVRAFEETGDRSYLVDAGLVPRAERRRQARVSKKGDKKLRRRS